MLMKKWASVIMAFALGAALVSCSNEGVSSDTQAQTQGSQSVTQTDEDSSGEDTQSVTTTSQTASLTKSSSETTSQTTEQTTSETTTVQKSGTKSLTTSAATKKAETDGYISCENRYFSYSVPEEWGYKIMDSQADIHEKAAISLNGVPPYEIRTMPINFDLDSVCKMYKSMDWNCSVGEQLIGGKNIQYCDVAKKITSATISERLYFMYFDDSKTLVGLFFSCKSNGDKADLSSITVQMDKTVKSIKFKNQAKQEADNGFT